MIILIEISKIDFILKFEIIFKTINDLINLNNFVSILLFFDIYFQIIEINILFFTIIQRVVVIKKTMNEINVTPLCSSKWRTAAMWVYQLRCLKGFLGTVLRDVKGR